MLESSYLSNSLCRMVRRVLLNALYHYLLQAEILSADFNLAVSTLIAKQPTLISPSNLPALWYYIIIHHMMIWMHKMVGLNTLHEHGLSMYPEKFSNLRVTCFGMSCVARNVKSKPCTCKVCTYNRHGQAMMKTALVA